jgi:cleavage stimulation factor subunit 3
MEYHVSKVLDVPSRIFEKGMEFFSEEADYVLRYLAFLISVNDNNSTCSGDLLPLI